MRGDGGEFFGDVEHRQGDGNGNGDDVAKDGGSGIECTASEGLWRLIELTWDHLWTASTLRALPSRILEPFARP
jgi:hypothetical protein